MKPRPKSKNYQRPEPEVRQSPRGGIYVEGIDSYSREDWIRAKLGAPPANFQELLKLGLEIMPLVQEACGVPPDSTPSSSETTTAEQRLLDLQKVRDVLMLSAWALTETANDGDGENPVAFVQRAKQVIDWCKPIREGLTLLEKLEAKGREIARVVAQRLARHENAVLFIMDTHTDGSVTWFSTIPRNDALRILQPFINDLIADQGARS